VVKVVYSKVEPPFIIYYDFMVLIQYEKPPQESDLKRVGRISVAIMDCQRILLLFSTMKKATVIIAICFFGLQSAFSQTDKLVQLSGLVLTSDSLMGIPYATVIIKHQARGTFSNYQGFFSLVAALGDTIKFTGVGFKTEMVVIPDTLSKSRYSIIQLLTQDTVYLPETVIYPWPTKDEFRQAFLTMNVPDDDLDRARRNLEREKLKEIGESMETDAKETTDYYYRMEAQRFSYTGQIPPQNIFNPFAWAKFIDAWKRGDFKKK